MISAPWYLLAAGIALVVIGALLTVLTSRDGGRGINPRMRDKDIARELKRQQQVPLASLVILAGLVCILVSIGWRIARAVL